MLLQKLAHIVFVTHLRALSEHSIATLISTIERVVSDHCAASAVVVVRTVELVRVLVECV